MDIIKINNILKLFNNCFMEFEEDIKILEKLIRKYGVLE